MQPAILSLILMILIILINKTNPINGKPYQEKFRLSFRSIKGVYYK
jgi:hypothetical protein